jgi:hypothetical protein
MLAGFKSRFVFKNFRWLDVAQIENGEGCRLCCCLGEIGDHLLKRLASWLSLG